MFYIRGEATSSFFSNSQVHSQGSLRTPQCDDTNKNVTALCSYFAVYFLPQIMDMFGEKRS